METINDLVSRGLIVPHVSHSFPLAEVRVWIPTQLSVCTRDLCPGEGGAARQVGQEDRGRRRGGLQLDTASCPYLLYFDQSFTRRVLYILLCLQSA